MRKDCERGLSILEEEGYIKSFEYCGTESTLIYKKDSIKVTLMWQSQDGNPWFVIKTKEKEVFLFDFDSEIRSQHGFIKPGKQNLLNWCWKLMSRKEYLNIIVMGVKKIELQILQR